MCLICPPGNDVGTQYSSVIFYHSDQQRETAARVIAEFQNLLDEGRVRYSLPRVVTQLKPATMFYEAEREHQQYLENNPGGYCNHFYRIDELRSSV